MTSKTYIIPMRAPSAPRKVGSGQNAYMPVEYREAQYELRKAIIDKYGPFRTIEPIKGKPATKTLPLRPAFRNVRIDLDIFLTERSSIDIDNAMKFALDTFGPFTQRHLLERDLKLGWQPLYRNDRQVVGGLQLIHDYAPYNELRFTITELSEPLPVPMHNNMPQGNNEVSND